MSLMIVLLAFAACLAGASAQCNTYTPFAGGITVLRPPQSVDAVRNCPNPECTAIYQIDMKEATAKQFTTQCNDLGMLPPHGIDQTLCVGKNPSYWSPVAKNYINYPYPTDQLKQNYAKSVFSVTALTESPSVAFPVGFKFDTLKDSNGVCVRIINVENRWLEIMASTTQQNRNICVRDWDRMGTQSSIAEEACGHGDLYTCRDSGTVIDSTGKFTGAVSLIFQCRQNCDETETDFYWRITASQETPKPLGIDANGKPITSNVRPDPEDWCMMRSATDFPNALLAPYPDQYAEPAVFQKSTSAAAAPHASMALVALLALASIFVLLCIR